MSDLHGSAKNNGETAPAADSSNPAALDSVKPVDTIEKTAPSFQPPRPVSREIKQIASVQGVSPESGQDWKDLGIVDVPVADLPSPEGVSSAADFNHHIVYDQAVQATQALPRLQAEVKAGKGRDDFWCEDQAAGLSREQGRERLYDLYYGDDPITVEKIGNQYNILSGRHRIFAAQQAGLETIPAHVREKTN